MTGARAIRASTARSVFAVVAALAVAGCASRQTADAKREAPARDVAAAHPTKQATAPEPAPAPAPKPTSPAVRPAPAPPQQQPVPKPAWVALTPKVRCNRGERTVEFDAVAVLKTGFLEQLVCLVGTREHEALFAFEGKASDVHAALLFVGLEPGAPGRWQEVNADGASRIEAVAPTGAPLSIEVLLPDGAAHPIDWFVRASPLREGPLRAAPANFVFAGSRLVRSKSGDATRYLADSSGSLVGLVTFGDETIGCLDVIPDQASVSEPVWEAWSERLPEPGARVRVRISPKR